jgi:RNA polymerase sigma factor (sigma-70 family)
MVSTTEQDGPLSALEQYKRAVKWTPQLQEEEEAWLLQCLEQGEHVQQARDRLVAGYQPLIFALARRFVHKCRVMELMDLVQEGNQGLLLAIERYDGKRDTSSFRTWAFERIRGMMLTAFWQYEQAIRLPWHKVLTMRRIKTVNDALFLALGREPSLAEIAVAMKMAERDVRELLVLRELHVVSLDTPLDEDGDVTLGETIEDAATSALSESDGFSLEDVLEHLTEHERAVILVRYGFGDNQSCTQAETAQVLGMRLNKVQELDRRARIRLRRVLELQAS